MNLRVIDGGRGSVCEANIRSTLPPDENDVRREARRRLDALDVDRWRNREKATGMPVPRDIRYLAMQVAFVADTLSALPSVPADFQSDIYWPRGDETDKPGAIAPGLKLDRRLGGGGVPPVSSKASWEEG